MARKNLFYRAVIVDDGVDGECRIYHCGNSLACLANGVATQQTSSHTASPPAAFEIERAHVRCFDRARGREPGTDRFPPTGEPGEIMKANSAGKNYLRKIFQ